MTDERSAPTDPVDEISARRGFVALLVGRPVTVLMLFLTILGTGIMTYGRIPLTFLPSGFVDNSFSVSLPYPGAGPTEVQEQLARPVEEELRTIPGVTDIITVSREGNANLQVVFSTNTDLDVAYGAIRDRIERVRPALPAEMDRYRVRRFDPDSLPIAWMGVQLPEGDDGSIVDLIERVAVPRIEGVDGVAASNVMGVVEEVVRIFVDFDRAMGYGVNLGDVIAKMQADNFTLPAGKIDDGGRTFSLRIDARFESIEAVERYPIGNGLVLSDVAEVYRGKALRDDIWRINGRDSLGLSVSKESGKNTVEVCTALEAMIDELEDDPRFEGVTFNQFWSQKEEILSAINSLQSSALWGGLFAVIVLFLFLRDVRMTLIAALAIPSSLLAAITAVYFNGMTLNILTLAGFTLGIGMLVDNAVVVIENIVRKRAEGLTRLGSASAGAGEVGLAVLTATLTSVVVFLPLVFMQGDPNDRLAMEQVGLPISFSLLASLLVAMVFIPTFAARLMPEDSHGISEQVSPRLTAAYQRMLSWFLDHRFGAFVVLLVVLQVAGGLSETLKFALQDDGGMNRVRMDVDIPSNFNLNDANQVFVHLEGWIDENREALDIEFYSCDFDRRGGSMNFWPSDTMDRDRREDLDKEIRALLPELPGVELTIGWEGSEASKDVRYDLEGPDFGQLARIVADVKERLVALTVEQDGQPVPLLENVKSDIDDGLDEVHILVNRERTSELGIDPGSIRGMVAWGLGGQRLPDLQLGERELKMAIEYAQDEEESLEFVRNLGLWRSNVGGTVPLDSVSDFKFTKSVPALVRRNGRTSLGISATPAVEDVYVVDRLAQQALAQVPLPEGYAWRQQGGRERFEESTSAFQQAGMLSLVLVYLLMAILLESIILPLCILLTVPLAIVGAFITLALTQTPFDAMVIVGFILLVGIVVNNAIVLLDRVQRLREAGVERREALLRGGGDRLRPILMTALTTICGLLPMAMPGMFPGNSGDAGYQSMAITVAGGLAFSTLLTLLVVPWAYTLMDDLGRVLRRLLPSRAALDTRPEPGSRLPSV